MLLVIDNYDSFTYNLVQYLGELGEQIEVRRNDQVTVDEIESKLKPARILISPGPGTPDDAGVSMKVIESFAGRVPVPRCLSGSSGHRSGVRRPRRSRAATVSREIVPGAARR